MGTRRNPRRAAAATTSLAEDNDGSENPASSSASVAEESSDDESLDNALVVRTKKRSSSTRTSSRSTRFQNSMEEPRDSIRDLLDGKSEIEFPRKTKSPAKSHSSARRRVRTEVPVDSDSASSSEEEEESDTEEDEQESLKIQRIVASRSEPRRVWKQLVQKMHTSEIEYGSRWYQENDDDDTFEERFLVKWSDLSYMHCSWESQQDLVEQVDGAKTYLTTFFRKSENGLLFTADERCDGDYFDPAYVQIDRIVEAHLPEGMSESKKRRADVDPIEEYGIVLDRNDPNFEAGTGRQLLIKWKNTPYSSLSYEFERDLILNEIEYLGDLKALEDRNKKVREKC